MSLTKPDICYTTTYMYDITPEFIPLIFLIYFFYAQMITRKVEFVVSGTDPHPFPPLTAKLVRFFIINIFLMIRKWFGQI